MLIHICKLKKAITLLMAFLCIGFSHSSVAETTESKTLNKLYFSLEGENFQPSDQAKTNFECNDKVYSVFELNNYPKAKYNLSIRWNNPAGEEQERVDYPFTVTQNKTRLWAWLNLIRSRGAGMITWINPAAGLEEFVGPWNVDVYINNEKVNSASFSVDC